MNELQQQYSAARDLLLSNQTEQAIETLDALHVACHTEALMHMKTHLLLSRAHLKNGNPGRAAFELGAIPFAGPASLVHKYLGVSRKL